MLAVIRRFTLSEKYRQLLMSDLTPKVLCADLGSEAIPPDDVTVSLDSLKLAHTCLGVENALTGTVSIGDTTHSFEPGTRAESR